MQPASNHKYITTLSDNCSSHSSIRSFHDCTWLSVPHATWNKAPRNQSRSNRTVKELLLSTHKSAGLSKHGAWLPGERKRERELYRRLSTCRSHPTPVWKERTPTRPFQRSHTHSLLWVWVAGWVYVRACMLLSECSTLHNRGEGREKRAKQCFSVS